MRGFQSSLGRRPLWTLRSARLSGSAARLSWSGRRAKRMAGGKTRWAAWDNAAKSAHGDEEAGSVLSGDALGSCYREQMLVAARQAGSAAAAEKMLAGIVADDAYRSDWQLHLQYGRYALLAARDLLRSAVAGSGDLIVLDYLAHAREAVARSTSALSTAGGAVPALQDVRATGAAISTWESLASSSGRAAGDIRSGRQPARRPMSRRGAAIPGCDDPTAGPECRQLLQAFWNAERNDARGHLERRCAQAQDDFRRVDALLAITLLFPEDSAVVARLRGLVNEALRVTKQEAAEVCFDASGGRFLERHARQNRSAPPPDHVVASLQSNDVSQVLGRLGVMEQVLEVVARADRRGPGVGFAGRRARRT